MLLRAEYNNLLYGINVKPSIMWGQDITGIAILPAQNFIQGTKYYTVGLDFELSPEWSTHLFYQGSTGGGSVNTQRDRDILGMSVSYTF